MECRSCSEMRQTIFLQMKKTLYIQIDNNSLPEGCGEDVEVLDCRCINDFCSLVGDSLVGDLKDENGKPFYRW